MASLRELSDHELLEVWYAELATARHWQEFAELPPIRGDVETKEREVERFSLAISRCAAVRKHALERRPDLFMPYRWPAALGPYEKALEDLDRRLAEQRTKEGG